MSADFNPTKMYSYLKGYCAALGWDDALRAMAFARDAHRSQTRKGGQPYIIHPLSMACHAAALGLQDEDIITACLLHDVVEDCPIPITDLPIESEEAKKMICALTHNADMTLDEYYDQLRKEHKAGLVKLMDRCDNVSTMAGVFTPEKTMSYIEETRKYVIPLWRDVKNFYPEHSNALFVLKYHIISVIDGLEACLIMPSEDAES